MLVRLEMDAKRMSIVSFDLLPVWAAPAGLIAHLGAGFGLGLVYFRSLWWSTRRFGGRGSLVMILALMICRFAAMAAMLALASLEGALPLLAAAFGVLAARYVVVSRLRETAS